METGTNGSGTSGPQPIDVGAKLKVIGVGGGGCNAVKRMYQEDLKGVQLIAVNTDIKALLMCSVPNKIQIGAKLTRGLGAGADPKVGRQAAEESKDEIAESLRGADMIFIAAGMGGGTGTGAAPAVAEIAKETGALTVAICTLPFGFEGSKRRAQAMEGLNQLRDKVDTLIVVSNDKLLTTCSKKMTVDLAFKTADDVLVQAVAAISDLINMPGEINVDFADVRTIMAHGGSAIMAIGRGSGESRAVEAARSAIQNPLLDLSLEGAKGVLLNITGGADLTLAEVNAAADIISKAVDPDAHIIFGVVHNPNMDKEVTLTVIATGVNEMAQAVAAPSRAEPAGQFAVGLPHANREDVDIPTFLRRSRQRVG